MLSQNYPNPFNPSTVSCWQLSVGGHVTLKVFDVLGNEVATLVNEEKEAGSYTINFNVGQITNLSYLPSYISINFGPPSAAVILFKQRRG